MRPWRLRPALGGVVNHQRLLGPIGFMPPAEYEAHYHEQAAVACSRKFALRRSRANSLVPASELGWRHWQFICPLGSLTEDRSYTLGTSITSTAMTTSRRLGARAPPSRQFWLCIEDIGWPGTAKTQPHRHQRPSTRLDTPRGRSTPRIEMTTRARFQSRQKDRAL